MQEALLGAAVVVVVVVVAELLRRRRPRTRCPKCASESLLVLNDSDTMRECGACGHIFSL
jgi:ribosomal protein L37AE/L43A